MRDLMSTTEGPFCYVYIWEAMAEISDP
jgi:hypothetical protein